jgi:hypothetical protein
VAVNVNTNKADVLLAAIKKEIDEGKIDTWEYDKDGDFTHSPDQWRRKAWLRPHPQQGILAFGLLGEKNVAMTKTIYGIYHGRFIEMLLVHFDTEFTVAQATAMPTDFDNFKTT